MADISRKLTGGELRYAMDIFGSAIDYRTVLIHNYKAYFFQPDDTAITPNGEVYFSNTYYRPDFSTDIGNAAWLMHELTHVWQHQKGVWVRFNGVLHRNYNYGDLATTKTPFAGFQIEQQASIVGDYFKLSHGLKPSDGSGSIADYRRVIPFLPRSGQ